MLNSLACGKLLSPTLYPQEKGRFFMPPGCWIRPRTDYIKLFWSKVKKRPNGCWEWHGVILKGGYGQFYTYQLEKKSHRAHRFSYTITKGKIPKDFDIDHLCMNKICVNPEHLEAVTRKVNVVRYRMHVYKTRGGLKCKRGHSLKGDNLYIGKNGHRVCRACRRISDKKYRDYKRS